MQRSSKANFGGENCSPVADGSILSVQCTLSVVIVVICVAEEKYALHSRMGDLVHAYLVGRVIQIVMHMNPLKCSRDLFLARNITETSMSDHPAVRPLWLRGSSERARREHGQAWQAGGRPVLHFRRWLIRSRVARCAPGHAHAHAHRLVLSYAYPVPAIFIMAIP